MTYVDNGQYLRLKLKTIAKVRYKTGMSIAGINNALACLTDRNPSARCSRAMASNPRPPVSPDIRPEDVFGQNFLHHRTRHKHS